MPEAALDLPQAQQDVAVAGGELGRARELAARGLELVQAQVHQTELHAHAGLFQAAPVRQPQREGPLKGGAGLGQLPELGARLAELEPDLGVGRLERERGLELADGLGVLAAAHVQRAEHVGDLRTRGRALAGALEEPHGIGPGVRVGRRGQRQPAQQQRGDGRPRARSSARQPRATPQPGLEQEPESQHEAERGRVGEPISGQGADRDQLQHGRQREHEEHAREQCPPAAEPGQGEQGRGGGEPPRERHPRQRVRHERQRAAAVVGRERHRPDQVAEVEEEQHGHVREPQREGRIDQRGRQEPRPQCGRARAEPHAERDQGRQRRQQGLARARAGAEEQDLEGSRQGQHQRALLGQHAQARQQRPEREPARAHAVLAVQHDEPGRAGQQEGQALGPPDAVRRDLGVDRVHREQRGREQRGRARSEQAAGEGEGEQRGRAVQRQVREAAEPGRGRDARAQDEGERRDRPVQPAVALAPVGLRQGPDPVALLDARVFLDERDVVVHEAPPQRRQEGQARQQEQRQALESHLRGHFAQRSVRAVRWGRGSKFMGSRAR